MESFSRTGGESALGEGAGWRDILKNSIVSADKLYQRFNIDTDEIETVIKRYPMRVNPYYFALIQKINDPLWIQAIPSMSELEDEANPSDPLFEEGQSPVRSIIHRYPDRVIFLVSNKCAMYCRHCMRKRKVGDSSLHFSGNGESIEKGLEYIRENKTISDVILSGGDPLLLETSELESVLSKIHKIAHVEIIRIHSRVLCTLPQRITSNLVSMLKNYQPLYINTHFNHPDELTKEASTASARLADAGIALGCQTVLLKGVNDSSETMAQLMKKLLKNRIRPYYLHHPDQVKGTGHLRPSITEGLKIMADLRGHNSGLCVPQYMIDLPGGGGKVPLLPDYIQQKAGGSIVVKNFEGKLFEYS